MSIPSPNVCVAVDARYVPPLICSAYVTVVVWPLASYVPSLISM